MKNTPLERDEQIVELRQSGMLLREIGERFGIGQERVRQILLRAERKSNITGVKATMSTRLLNCLTNEGFDLDLPQRQLAQKIADRYESAGQLLRIPNFGRTSLKELSAFLAEHGVVIGRPSRRSLLRGRRKDRAMEEEEMSSFSDAALDILDQIRPHLAHKDPVIQGCAIADLLATWIAGHVSETKSSPQVEAFREQLLEDHLALVWKLVDLYDKQLSESGTVQ